MSRGAISIPPSDEREWLEADGCGGYASGTASGIRTRRYHALLVHACTPPTGRVALVDGFDAWLETPAGRQPLTSQRYLRGSTGGESAGRIAEFIVEPWPTWTFRLEGGGEVRQELFCARAANVVAVRWTFAGGASAGTLVVRPFLSGRDHHALQHANPALSFDARSEAGRVEWHTYPSMPRIAALHDGAYRHEPYWYRDFLYDEERARGQDCTGDLASPGELRFELARGEAWCIFGTDDAIELVAASGADARACGVELAAAEAKARARFASVPERSAEAYLVERGDGKTIVAGYPWFCDWGRDTFISMRGLCFALERWDEARAILLEWSRTVSQGMLPNRFVEAGEQPEFNSVDASLWFVVAAGELFEAARAGRAELPGLERAALAGAVEAILVGYAAGTRYGIRCGDDGLLAAGEPGVQLTWMDAKLGDDVITPRIGKPVEVQALWLNALAVGARNAPRWRELFSRGRDAFGVRFWNAERKCLYDVVDVDHVAGALDPTLRPNQILAVGGLPMPLLDGERARDVVESVEKHLWTPAGPRSLAPTEPGYRGRYTGDLDSRDRAYHQGTVWPWLAGPFVEAWVRVRGSTAAAKSDARRRFLAPLLAHLDEAGIGHASEIADGDAPHTPRGAPFQAWSLGELLRLEHDVLAPRKR